MKKTFISFLLFAGILTATVPVQASFGTPSGIISSIGSSVRYSFLATKNVAKTAANVAAAPIVTTYRHPRLTAMALGAVLVGLAALWYTSPNGFMTHPYVVAITKGTVKLTADAVGYAISVLEKCPEYAAWLRELSCHYSGQNCPIPVLPPVPTPCPPCPTCPTCPMINLW